MTTAYSYIRFSTPEQLKGDSKRRQLEKSQQYALEKGLSLDESLTFHDLGTSAYRGKNASDGNLGLFIAAIDEGKIAKGSYLLIENFDRLSRQPAADALSLLQSIVGRGITVVTLSDRREYSHETLRNDPLTLIVSILTMFRANEESQVKSDRLSAAWKRKKQQDAREGKPITSMVPAWLEVAEELVDGQPQKVFKVLKDHAKVVRKIYDLATTEGLGQRAIVTRLRQDGVPVFNAKKSSEWSESSVRRILTNPAVIGRYQPRRMDKDDPNIRHDEGEPIENYFPEVITQLQFHEAQHIRSNSILPRGPRNEGKAGSIFTGVAFCSCGATMRKKGASTNDPAERIRCSRACGAQSWKYKQLETAVILCLADDLLPHIENKETDRKKLQGDLVKMAAERDEQRKRIANFIDALGAGATAPNAIVTALAEAETRERQLTRKMLEADVEIAALESRQMTLESDGKAITALASAIREDGNAVKKKIRYALSRLIDKIVLVDSAGVRTARIEIGQESRFIDFSREDKTYRLRGGSAVHQYVAGTNLENAKASIP
jgi:DNA invertase Pin-like site-specific DNA recombinase